MYTSDNIVMIYGVLCFVEVGGGVIKAWKKPKRAIIFASWELPISWTRKASVRRTDDLLEVEQNWNLTHHTKIHWTFHCTSCHCLRNLQISNVLFFSCSAGSMSILNFSSFADDPLSMTFTASPSVVIFFASNFRALSLAKLLSKLAIFRRQPTVIFTSRCSSHNTTVLVNGYCFIIDKAYQAWIACNCRDWELLKHQCSLGFWHSHIQETPRGRVISQSGSNTCRLLLLSNMQ